MHPGGQQAWSPAQASTRRSGGGRRRKSSSSWVPVAWGTSFVNGVCQATHHGVQHPTRPASVAWGWSLPPCTCFPPPSLPLPCCPLLSSPKVGMTGQHLHRRAGEGRTPSPTPASGGAWPLRQGPGFCSSCGWSLGGCLQGRQGSRGCIPCSPGESGLASRGSKGLRSPLESRRGSLGGGVQTAKASRKQSSLSGKESAQGCLPKRLLGRPD